MNDFKTAPVVFFAFNRPEHTRRTLAALAANELAAGTDLYIFCDGPRSPADEEATAQVREICRNASGFASLHVHEQSVNQGLANSLITGISAVFDKHERVIVFEDDVLASSGTLRFLNACLERYQSEPVVFNISSWSPDPQKMGFPDDYPWDVYFVPRFHCWGWATWKDRWQSIDWELSTAPAFFDSPYAIRGFCQGGLDMPPMLRACLDKRIDSWAVRADFARFSHGRLGLNPLHAYVENIGCDNTGVHCGEMPQYAVDVNLAPVEVRFPEYIFVDDVLVDVYRSFLIGDSPMSADVEKLHAFIAAGDNLTSLAFFLHKTNRDQTEQLNALRQKMNVRFDALDVKLDALRKQMDAQTGALGQQGDVLRQELSSLRWNLRHPFCWLFRELRSKFRSPAKEAIIPRDSCDYNALAAISALQYCDAIKKKVLVIGCGTGGDCSYFLQAGAKEIHGVDVLEKIGCDLRHKKIHYHQRSAENMDCFSDNTFDLVYAFATLEHIPDIEATFREMHRVSKPGGIIFSLAAPLWHSRFGHHKQDLFAEYPWIHLLLSHEAIVGWFMKHKAQAMPDKAAEIEHHVSYMLNKKNFNMQPGKEYLAACGRLGLEIIANEIDFEPEELLTPEAKERLIDVYGMEELLGLTHRFIARKREI